MPDKVSKISLNMETVSYVSIFTVIYIINPLLSIVLCVAKILSDKKKGERYLFLLYAFIAIYLGLINSTKFIESDLLNYKYMFDLCKNVSLFEVVALKNKEPIFFAFTYSLNKIFFNNFSLYVIILTFIIYFNMFISIHRFWRYQTNSLFFVLFSITIFALYHSFFINSTHLIRQVLAGSVFFIFLIERTVSGKVLWVCLPIAILIHSSSGVLFLLAFLPGIEKKISLKRLLLMFCIIGIAILILDNLLGFLDGLTKNIPFLNYPFARLSTIENYSRADMRDFVVGANPIGNVYIPLLFMAIGMGIYFTGHVKERIFGFINIFIIFILIVFFLKIVGYLFISLRLNIYTIFFMPFLIPYLIFIFEKKHINSFRIMGVLMLGFMLIYFVNYLPRSIWRYDPLSEIAVKPFLSFLL
ncbi:EpsG family protein [Desulfobacter latus]|uniref:EpsG family protein n=1 Tax=Desulfobacter latus TaxID=2292 RepID=A0A850TED4_9BACT|nr:EpsG family protein [Desulfobacter latus]NWH05786.1 EpsG family protein [Desulfobacter latus]